MIAIVDYGVANVPNVERALRRAGAADVRVTRSHAELLAARAIVLPGVGHFGHCARELRRFGLDAMIRVAHDRGIPLLGLCVGMQLFFDDSEEDPGTPGLGLVRGHVRRLQGDVRVPHTGWNDIAIGCQSGHANLPVVVPAHEYASGTIGEDTRRILRYLA